LAYTYHHVTSESTRCGRMHTTWGHLPRRGETSM